MCYIIEWFNPATLSAFFSCLATIGLFYIAYKTKKEDEKKYARKVAIWTNGVQSINNSNFISTVIINLSESPIYDVYIVGCQYKPDEFKHVKSFGALGYRNVIFTNFDQTNKTFMDVEVIGDSKDMEGLTTVSMFFRDISEKEWCRDSHGILYECPNYIKFFRKECK